MAEEADTVFHNLKDATAEQVALLFTLGLQQAEDQLLLFETRITRYLKVLGHFFQFGHGFALKLNNVHLVYSMGDSGILSKPTAGSSARGIVDEMKCEEPG